MKTIAVLPVKTLNSAHGRLAGRLTIEQRKRLAEAMLFDMLGKLGHCATIEETIVVTADDSVERQARWLGHFVLKQGQDAGHSHAAGAGARAAIERGADRVAMLPTDCPLFDPAELDHSLGDTPRAAMIVPDRQGTGTNALVLSPPDAIEPAFGPDSCARHAARARAAGINFALDSLDSLALDLDTPEDMEALRDALLLDPDPAPRTSRILWDLGAGEADGTGGQGQEPTAPAPAA